MTGTRTVTGLAAASLAVTALAATALAQSSQSISAKFDFETVWADPSWESPYETSREHYDALLEAADGGTRHSRDTIPDWSGYWITDDNVGEIAIVGRNSTYEGMLQRLRAEAQPQYTADWMAWREDRAIDPLSLCLPPNFPRWFTEYGYRDFVTHPGKTILISEMVNQIRRIYTDGRDHPSEDWAQPEWNGTSIGFWDGDVLVIHTQNLREGVLQRNMPRQSDQMSTVERWRRVSHDRIEVELTMYDPVMFAEPWHTVNAFILQEGDPDVIRANQWVCEEGNHVFMEANGTVTQLDPSQLIDITDPDNWFFDTPIHNPDADNQPSSEGSAIRIVGDAR